MTADLPASIRFRTRGTPLAYGSGVDNSMLSNLADLLTMSRVAAALALAWLGTQGPQTLPAAILIAVVAWTSDQLDGWAARHSPVATRRGRVDFAVDALFYIAVLTYLALTGLVPPLLAAAYAVGSSALILAFQRKAVTVVFLRLVDLITVVIIAQREPRIALLLAGWLAVLTMVYRNRIVERAPRTLAELARLIGFHRRNTDE